MLYASFHKFRLVFDFTSNCIIFLILLELTFFCGTTGNRTPNTGVTSRDYSRLTMVPKLKKIMKEYPSRSNLNCFLSFNEASAKGGALLKFRFWIVDIRKTEKAIIFFCYPSRTRTSIYWTKTSRPAIRRRDNLFGGPCRARTCDPLIMSQVLLTN